jgi:hypothetical protein
LLPGYYYIEVKGDNSKTKAVSYAGNVLVTVAPLPGALPLFASGLGALGFVGWRKRKKAKLAA